MTANPTPPRPAPQLCMMRHSLDGLPAMAIPAGYRLADWRPGDEAAWENVRDAAFASPLDFNRSMRDDQAFRPERIKLIWRDQIPVATASAWHRSEHGKAVGCLHWVAVLPAESGKGLGLWVSLACLHHMHSEGRSGSVLVTDDHRLPAIVTYLKLGFEPLVVHESHPERWRAVFGVLNKPELATRFAAALAAPPRVFNGR